MSLETCKKIMKVTGILTFIGGVVSVFFGIMTAVMGGVGTQLPEAAADAEIQKGVVALLAGGIGESVSGGLSMIEGAVSYSAGKSGKHTTAAWIFAIVGLIGSVLQSITMIMDKKFTTTNIVSIIIAFVLNLMIFLAASKVRKASNNA